MYRLYLGLILTLWMSLVNTQAPVISVTTQKPYKCKSGLILHCTSALCCSSSDIVWYKGTIVLINAGNSKDDQKYKDKVNGNYAEMTILNLAKSDLDSNYSCAYDGQPSSNYVTLNITDYECASPFSWKCAGECVGYSLIGFIFVVVIGLAISKALDKLKKKFLIITVISGLVALVVDVIATLLIGGYTDWCEDSKGYICIFIGFGGALLAVSVIMFYCFSSKGCRN